MESVDPHDPWIDLFRRTLPELYAFVSRRVGAERTLAEDVTQETWLRAVKAWRAGGPPREPLAWLKTTARHLVLNHFRDARRRPVAAVAGVAFEAQLEFDPERTPTPDAAALVQHGLSKLRTNEAVLVEAFHLDGRTTRELAEEHGTSERAIEGRLHRARQKLKKILERSMS